MKEEMKSLKRRSIGNCAGPRNACSLALATVPNPNPYKYLIIQRYQQFVIFEVLINGSDSSRELSSSNARPCAESNLPLSPRNGQLYASDSSPREVQAPTLP